MRHRVVYLIKRGAKGYEGWKLPSLFAHCTSVRTKRKQILVQEASYRYVDGKDEATGVTFSEFALNKAEFDPTGVRSSVTFVEPGNVYRFTLDSAGVP